mmetsp:Transcript_25687/g.78956  ORF Transcript_25687/g.78956 Transcript_25687/m.78956 type:complete len:260 (-) Transcript_25687:568-1347(-)
MSMRRSCTTHWMTTASFRKGSWPSPDLVSSTHMSSVGMLSRKSFRMLAVTLCQDSGFRLFPACNSSCLNPSTPMRATASVSCWMQFSISRSTSSSRKDRELRWASKSLTRAVRAARQVGGPIDAAQDAAVPSERPASGTAPSGLRESALCNWWCMSSKSGLMTPLKTMRHVSSSKTTLPCSRKQSKTPFKAAARTSRRGSLTSIERPRKIGNQCAAGWLEPVRGPASGGAWPAAPVVEPSGGGCSERDLSARRSAACRR